MKWVSMAEQPHTSVRSPCTMPKRRLEWCKACCHWTLEQWKHVLWSDESCYLAVRQTNLGLEDPMRAPPAPMHSANCNVWWRRNNEPGLFFMVSGPLVPVKGLS